MIKIGYNMNLDSCKIAITRSLVHLQDITFKDPNIKYPYMVYDVYDTIENKIKYHSFTMLFKQMTKEEEMKAINHLVLFQKKMLQKSIDEGTLDIDFSRWDKITIEADVYILEEDMRLKGIDVGLKHKDKYLEKRFR